MDHEQFARRVLGMAPATPDDQTATLASDGVAAADPRPCIDCGQLTTAVFFDAVTLKPEPSRCASCREEYLGLTFFIAEGDEADDEQG